MCRGSVRAIKTLTSKRNAEALLIGLEQVANQVGCNDGAVRPSWKQRNAVPLRAQGSGLQSFAEIVGNHPADALALFLREAPGGPKNVVVQVQSGSHVPKLPKGFCDVKMI
jgi:hypothetical protein